MILDRRESPARPRGGRRPRGRPRCRAASGRRRDARTPRRILLLRLERIGDLVMALDAIRDVRTLAPAAKIDLVVGSWNADSRARCRTSIGRNARRRAGWRGTATGMAWRRSLGTARRGAIARYDLGDQLRAGRPQQSPARRVRRRTDGRMGERRRRTGARSRARLRHVGAHTPLTRAGSSRPRSAGRRRIPRGRCSRFLSRGGRRGLRGCARCRDDRSSASTSAEAARSSSGTPRGSQRSPHGSPTSAAPRSSRTGSPADRPMVDAFVPARCSRDRSSTRGDDDLLRAGRAAGTDRPPRHRRHGPDASGGRRRHAGRRHLRTVAIRRAMRPAGPLDRVVRVDLPCSPCNRIRPPAGALRRPHAGLPRRTSPRRACSTPRSRCSTRRRRAHRAPRRRMTDAVILVGRGTGRREVRLSDVSRRVRRRTRHRRRHRVDQGSAARARRRRSPCATLHVSRRFAVVVRRALPAQAAGCPATLARSIRSLERLIERESPSQSRARAGADDRSAIVARQAAAARTSATAGRAGSGRSTAFALAAIDARASALTAAALASRLRGKRRAPGAARRRRGGVRASRLLARRTSATAAPKRTSARCSRRSKSGSRRERIAYVSVGPASNFRARRWWHPLRARRDRQERRTPVEALRRPVQLCRNRGGLWRDRHRMRRALWASDDLRERGLIRRLRLLADRPRGAGRHRAAAVAVVGAGHGRSRPPRSTRCSRASPSPTRKPAAGDAPSCWNAGAAAFRRPACSTASSTVTG